MRRRGAGGLRDDRRANGPQGWRAGRRARLPLPLLDLVRKVGARGGHADGTRSETDEARGQPERRPPVPLLAARPHACAVDKGKLEPVLDHGQNDHALVGRRVVEEEVFERERVGPERRGEQVLRHVEAHQQREVQREWRGRGQEQQEQRHAGEREAQAEARDHGLATPVRMGELGPRDRRDVHVAAKERRLRHGSPAQHSSSWSSPAAQTCPVWWPSCHPQQ